MLLWLRLLTFAVIVPGFSLGLVPRWILRSGWGGRFHVGRWQLLGWIPLLAGVVLMLWCWYDFAVRGAGTPAPYDPPRNLVVSGPYRVVRNPMYVAGTSFLLGLALVAGAPGIAAYAIFFWLLTAIFVFAYEQPALERRFGESYQRYRASVPAWIPRRPSR
jgi:protein-S-isoprenylcysteine O-methyltransferase Ste14